MTQPSETLVIAGSVRARRLGLQIAAWVAAVGAEIAGAPLDLIDLKDWPLPADDEPGVPAAGVYQHPHTLAWSGKVEAARAVVLVSPQYNWGYPATLKNALDHLYREWAGKPVLIVTYGGHGGDKCGRQLAQVCKALHMSVVRPQPRLRLPRALIEANAGEVDPATLFAAHLSTLRRGLRALFVAKQAAGLA